MAKSLRASNKVKARNARRYTPNTDYAIIHAARLNAIAKKLEERTKGPTISEVEEKAKRIREGDLTSQKKFDEGEAKEDVQAMQVDKDFTPKISTSGPRGARRETWRKAKGWAPKRGSKNAGKPKRRR